MDTAFPFDPAGSDAMVRIAIASAVAKNAAPAAVELDSVQGITIVKLVGEHDLSDSHLLTAALRTTGDGARILVDLSDCTCLDLSAMGRLIATCRRLRARGGRLELFIPLEADAMWTVARRTGLATCLTTHTSREAGIAALTSARDELPPDLPRAGSSAACGTPADASGARASTAAGVQQACQAEDCSSTRATWSRASSRRRTSAEHAVQADREEDAGRRRRSHPRCEAS